MIEGYKGPKNLFAGAELLERGEGGYEKYQLEPGVYQMQFGFRNFGQHEADWFSRASDRKTDWETPFVFDYDHPVVAQFTERLLAGNDRLDSPEAIKELTRRFSQLIPSMSINEPEFNNSLSDVVRAGRGMCDAKSVLLGSVLARHTNLEAQAITGQYGKVGEKVSYPFSHQWMRITDGSNLYLFDPMYERLAVFEQDGEAYYAMDENDAHFDNLTPGCYPAGKLISQMGIQRWGGVKAVESYDGNGFEIYVDNEESLSSQLTNATTFAFEIDSEQDLEVHDGAVRTGTENASLYFPVQNFQKVE